MSGTNSQGGMPLATLIARACEGEHYLSAYEAQRLGYYVRALENTGEMSAWILGALRDEADARARENSVDLLRRTGGRKREA